ncbi:hypothetical protein MARI_13050 [Marinobacter sp. JH2]|nr:glycosyltransferase family 4 protein [Marinobacter sp. JH2]QBM17199.1 hypothetical protein MARI_13050 [Marinobacter sp. JH2]
MNVLMTAMQPGGGIRTFFRYIYSQHSFDNDTFTLIAPDPDGQLAFFLSNTLGDKRFKVVVPPWGSLGFTKTIRSVIKEGNFDLLHSHGFGAGLLSQIAITGLNSPPHLMTAHDVFLSTQFDGCKGQFRKVLMAMLFKRMDGIHTVTADATDNFKQFFPSVPERFFHPILHGVDTDFFYTGEPEDLREKLALHQETPLIGFFGRFMGQKGFRTLVDAVFQLKERNCSPLPKVLTFGWGGFIREDYEYVASLGLNGTFVQMPATDNMPAMIKAVDMVAMPSRWEACGLLGMEVLAAGVPLLATDCIGLREVVADSPARLFSPGDSSALADLIQQELQEPTKDRFVKYQGTAVERFHISRPADELRALYQKMVDC